MSYYLKTVLDELEGGGMITTDDDLVIETLNDDLGLNIHHDLVITSKEVQQLRNALVSLQAMAIADSNEFFESLAESCLEILK